MFVNLVSPHPKDGIRASVPEAINQLVRRRLPPSTETAREDYSNVTNT